MLIEQKPRDWIILKRDVINVATDRPRKSIHAMYVFSAIEGATGFKKASLVSKSRRDPLIIPRYMAMFFLHNNTSRSLPQVGMIMNRHHATVLYGCRVIKKKMMLEPEFRQYIKALGIDIERRSRSS